MHKVKISLIGAGNIGSSLAYLLGVQNKVQQIVLYDVNYNPTAGKSLDILQALAVLGHDIDIKASSDIEVISDSEVIVVTAGIARKPGMVRDDLFNINLDIIKSLAENIKRYSPKSLVIVVTNPIDAMVYAMYKFSGLPKNQILGMAGVLDIARYKYFISQEFKVSVSDIDAFILGGHGDFMVPLKGYTTISGIPISEFIAMGYGSMGILDKIIERTKYGGGEIVSLLGNCSAYYAPATAIMEMIDSYIFNKRKILSSSVLLEGEYGYRDVFVGVPIILSRHGVEEIINLNLSQDDQKQFDISVGKIKSLLKFIK